MSITKSIVAAAICSVLLIAGGTVGITGWANADKVFLDLIKK